MNSLRKFFTLRKPDRLLLLRTGALVGFVRLWLWVAPYRPLHALLTRWASRTFDSSRISRTYPERAAWAVNAVCRRIPGARTCLVEALALEFMLKRHGFDAQLKLGVCRDPAGRVRAHAWVESDGQIVIGAAEMSRYTVLTTLKGSVDERDSRNSVA